MELSLFDLKPEPTFKPVACEKVSLNPVIKNIVSASAKTLFPFSDKLNDFHVNGNQGKPNVITGKVVDIQGESVSICGVKNPDETYSVSLDSPKKPFIELGDRISVLMDDDKCVDVKLGPYYGTISWNLFYKNDKKSATKFELKA